MTNQSIVKAATTTLSQFGNRDDIKELAERIKTMLPGGQKYSLEEAYTLAQIATAHDLDPFNGEAWLIKDNEGKCLGALIGIKGFRKHAKKQANYWGMGQNGGFTRVTDPKKIEEYGAKPGDFVYEYRIMDEKTLEGYSSALHKMIHAGLSLEASQVLLGPPPCTIGIGIYVAGERTKMRPAQCAMYRAEKDALKRRFDVKWKFEMIEGTMTDVPLEISEDEPEAEELEGEYEQLEGAEAEQEQREQKIQENLNQLGFSV